MNRIGYFAAAGIIALLLLPALAAAHVERTSYWPDPKPDTTVNPAAGGKVPTARSLASALRRSSNSKTRVVCQPGSMKRAKREIRRAQRSGYRNRPTDPLKRLSKRQAKRWLLLNTRFAKKCRFSEIQPAVNVSRNNDRIVIMPGVYTEPTVRKIPNFPPECDQYREQSDHGSGAVSYSYQYHCPNAQALVAVIGRGLSPEPDPQSSPTGRPDPHGIKNAGPCIRCNLQMEGSGPAPDDTVIDAGRVQSGDGAPIGSVKDVGLKADRADGFVLRDVTVRHAAEHDVYVLESDGYLLERNRYMYAGEYGTLTFASDHGLTMICEAAGNGDSGVYPGGAPDTGEQRDPSFYPERRLNQTITQCDSHHNNLGYSGTMGNATHVVNNNFYDNTTGIATDSFYAGGHPGYPQDSAVFEGNRIYSNNFNVYGQKSDVESRVPVPIGVGILIGGGNFDEVTKNYIFDNWKRGTMLMAVPDAISCAPNPDAGAPACTPQQAATTSNGNRYYDNTMGRSPAGQQMPNGVDFWWDEFPTNQRNCWGPNVGVDGTPASITSDPPRAPGDATTPGYLPVKDCDSAASAGRGNPQKEAVLGACAADFEQGSYDSTVCDWFTPPEKPGSPQAQQQLAQQQAAAVQAAGTGDPFKLPSLCNLLGGAGGTLTCSPFQHRLG